jgi:SAM-dependent methyltransferase
MHAPGSDRYDDIAYPSYPFWQTHPDRLAVIASLFGMQPAPVGRCRVLELGGGDGGNLIPMALVAPDATFVGIDLAADPIARGQRTVRDLGLTNITLVRGDVCELAQQPPPAEPFDYIIAHGLFSWVPDVARVAVLEIMGRWLAPQGVAYLSFNAYPGGHLRQMVREILQYHTDGLPDGQRTIAEAQSLARVLADALPDGDATASVRASLRTASTREPGALYHDELSPDNKPFYFHEVVEQAAAYGLQYLGEADFSEMQDQGFTPEAREILAAIERERGRIAREQYMDFLKARQFRQTLLCRADARIGPMPTAPAVRRLLISANLRAESPAPNLSAGVVERFIGPRNAVIQIDMPIVKAAFVELGSVWPDRLTFDELAARAARRLRAASPPRRLVARAARRPGRPAPAVAPAGAATSDDEPGREMLASALFASYSSALVELHAWKPSFVLQAGDRPTLSPLARLQLAQDDVRFVTTLLHGVVFVESPLARQSLRLLDGTRDRATLLSELRTWSRQQAAAGQPTDEITPESIEARLRDVGRHGLLVG